MKIAAAYIRVSTEDQTELSPDSQVKKIREYAETHGYVVPDEYIFHDDGISGRSTKKRQGFNHMIALAKSNPIPFEAILVWKFSRFARNREDSIVFKSMLKKRGISVISISEAVGDDKMSILVESLIEAMDEYYSVNLSEEVIRGMAEKVSRGKPVSIPPLGYKIENGEFIIDEETAPIVRRIFNEALAGKPCRNIAMDLNSDGIRTRRGNLFENRTVLYLLRNPVYAGYIRWDNSGRGSRGFYRDGTETLVKGSHDVIINKEDFDTVQNLIKPKVKYMRTDAIKNDFMLRGIVRCSDCGATLVHSGANRLQCYAYAHGKCDKSHSVSIDALNAAVIQALKNDLEAFNLNNSDKPLKLIRDTDNLIKKEQQKLKRAEEAYLAGIDSLAEYGEKKKAITATIEQLQQETRNTAEYTPRTRKTMKELIRVLESPDETEASKNRALKAIVKAVIYNRDTNSITIQYFLN
jgi:DNA invertase Pin-like site-specific DNA recombinase